MAALSGRAFDHARRRGEAAPEKGLITRKTDIADSRRRVLHLSESAQLTYAAIIKSFVEREKQMLETLDPAERRELVRLFGKIIAAADAWAKPY